VLAAAGALLLPAPALASTGSWSAPARLEPCAALEGARAIFPSDEPDRPTGPGGVVWRASAACPGGEGPRVARLDPDGVPGPPTVPVSAQGGASGPRGALAVSAAPHGQILIAGASGGPPIQGLAGGPFAPLGGLSGIRGPLALTSAYLGDVALASSSGEALQLHVERYFARTIDRSAEVSASGARAIQALTLAMDFRTDAVAVWAHAGSIYARDMPASGAPQPIQRLARAPGELRVAALLSDDNRAIVAWSEESRGETSVYVDRSAVGVRFGSPTLLERFQDPEGLVSPAASPRLVRLSSESVMMAWSGAADGHWAVRSAAIDLQGVGAPTTISPPGTDALLADLAPGPDGDALVLWSQPQPSDSGVPNLRNQSIFAARGFDAYPRRTIFGDSEEVAPAGPNSDASVALNPADDGAVALWQGENGAIEYSIRAVSNTP